MLSFSKNKIINSFLFRTNDEIEEEESLEEEETDSDMHYLDYVDSDTNNMKSDRIVVADEENSYDNESDNSVGLNLLQDTSSSDAISDEREIVVTERIVLEQAKEEEEEDKANSDSGFSLKNISGSAENIEYDAAEKERNISVDEDMKKISETMLLEKREIDTHDNTLENNTKVDSIDLTGCTTNAYKVDKQLYRIAFSKEFPRKGLNTLEHDNNVYTDEKEATITKCEIDNTSSKFFFEFSGEAKEYAGKNYNNYAEEDNCLPVKVFKNEEDIIHVDINIVGNDNHTNEDIANAVNNTHTPEEIEINNVWKDNRAPKDIMDLLGKDDDTHEKISNVGKENAAPKADNIVGKDKHTFFYQFP